MKRLTKEIAEEYTKEGLKPDRLSEIDSEMRDYTHIDDDAAEIMAKDPHLKLWSLEELSDKSAEALSKVIGTLDFKNGLTKISDAAAKSLGTFRGMTLKLNALEELSEEAAEGLAAYHGEHHLNALTSLSEGAAEKLSAHENTLRLDGLTELSDGAAQGLGRSWARAHRGLR